ncbi:hypothetical protein NUU61_007702 [Penicillium alfredii]|uniref:Uncharacterized protein n=1 Tax=Penicillium alfredii TaxID=1506179 RepID=A0A9W9ER73_9EURO|nr:uncharacterized protein NUU61_007702 [Penicillium alfredii]KAJ5086395.1 hypothetical protein NUU61_007702 [Penicillium alfredii]
MTQVEGSARFGFILPLEWAGGEKYQDLVGFPNGLDANHVRYWHLDRYHTKRDILMMRLMNSVTDQPNWRRKIFHPSFISGWCAKFDQLTPHINFKAKNWIIEELQWRAGQHRESGMVDAFDGIVKSDTAIPENLRRSLMQATRALEDAAGYDKNYRPGTGNTVVDIVDPAMFPFIYGRSAYLPDGVVGVENCLDYVGAGEMLKGIEKYSDHMRRWWEFADNIGHTLPFGYQFDTSVQYTRENRAPFKFRDMPTPKFQCLPCDVSFSDDGCHIESYINNIHPQQHKDLYKAIEKILTCTIPLWDAVLSQLGPDFKRVQYRGFGNPHFHQDRPEFGSDSFWDEDHIRKALKGQGQDTFESYKHQVKLRENFHDTGLQVIVKMVNVELTPDNPVRMGELWHLEGQPNEYICATAVYCYDMDNITPSGLDFRHIQPCFLDCCYNKEYRGWYYSPIDTYDRYWPWCDGIDKTFGFPFDEERCSKVYDNFYSSNITRYLGRVLNSPGRLTVYPNIFENQHSGFLLADRSRPGHCKTLVFSLVDPHIRIISSANVPPQRKDWWEEREQLVVQLLYGRLPVELADMISAQHTDFGIDLEEAKTNRLHFMSQRKPVEFFHRGGWNCRLP